MTYPPHGAASATDALRDSSLQLHAGPNQFDDPEFVALLRRLTIEEGKNVRVDIDGPVPKDSAYGQAVTRGTLKTNLEADEQAIRLLEQQPQGGGVRLHLWHKDSGDLATNT